ncbi:hypothetical protein D9M68_970390 [compost metagenome]
MNRQAQGPELVRVAIWRALGGEADVPGRGGLLGDFAQRGADLRVVGDADLVVFHRPADRVGQRFLHPGCEGHRLDAVLAELVLGVIRPADAEAGGIDTDPLATLEPRPEDCLLGRLAHVL